MGQIRKAHDAYLKGAAMSADALRPRFRNFAHKLQAFLRKEPGSANALKAVPNLARLLFGLVEDVKRLRLPGYQFALEKEALCAGVIAALDSRRQSNYFNQCASYGETLLNCVGAQKNGGRS